MTSETTFWLFSNVLTDFGRSVNDLQKFCGFSQTKTDFIENRAKAAKESSLKSQIESKKEYVL